ncbi:hypothetical protein M406DRAFT_356577 [Cryphonectria parasitica EP155]|uniref:Uncharacterized protein n=1 Tax=Cryphonectria parasitica (strain ATCC 38755 / EP155) TaxID=660469 RepID=A0A9P4Y0X3_CRYP1|nr:uncharacterized protein M406DRAFT_356577 [Cryphonectria parasitica EP155]KAF3764516.1 hypothetical protein M406DRAFT_356577 [Cryphonectria parasitica EP155]
MMVTAADINKPVPQHEDEVQRNKSTGPNCTCTTREVEICSEVKGLFHSSEPDTSIGAMLRPVCMGKDKQDKKLIVPKEAIVQIAGWGTAGEVLYRVLEPCIKSSGAGYVCVAARPGPPQHGVIR